MNILAIVSGEYGRRHVENIRTHGPAGWQIQMWQAPAVLPPIVDYPEDHLPEEMPSADLLLSFGELKGIAELLPEIASRTGARAVIAPVDNEAWLPRGLARQLRGWLDDIGVTCVTPKPLCSLTETHYALARRRQIEYDNSLIAAFARRFGRPHVRLTVDPQTRRIAAAEVLRDAVCGCARHVAGGLIGTPVQEAVQQAGLLHHHYPCMASMGIDTDYGDTLMHVSGNLLKDDIRGQIKALGYQEYIKPGA